MPNPLAPISRNALLQEPTVDNAVLEMFGMQPGMDRLNLLPRRDPRLGWVAPNALYQLARALVSPGVAAHGGYVSPEDAVNFAGNVSLGAYGASRAAPATGPGKTVGMFAGPKAKTANLDALQRAHAMVSEGADDAAIWRETGWWVNTPDGVPRFEIPDQAANYSPGAEFYSQRSKFDNQWMEKEDAALLRSRMEDAGESVGDAKEWFRATFKREPHEHAGQWAKSVDKQTLVNEANRWEAIGQPTTQNWDSNTGRVLQHGDAYAAYPWLAETGFSVRPQGKMGLGTAAYWSPSEGAMTIGDSYAYGLESGKSLALHEAQHAIQGKEGMARGGMPEEFGPMAQQEAIFNRDALNWAKELRAERKKWPAGTDVGTLENAVIENYQKLGIADWMPSETARNLGRQPFMVYPELYPGGAKQVEERVRTFGLDKQTVPRQPEEVYRLLAGEAEARAVQSRMNLPDNGRRAIPPWESYDVPLNALIIRR